MEMQAGGFCTRCGNATAPQDKFCKRCGASLQAPATSEPQLSADASVPYEAAVASGEFTPPPSLPPASSYAASSADYFGTPPAPAYAAAPAHVASAPATTYGGFWIRFGAYLIDMLILMAGQVGVAMIFALMIGAAGYAVGMPERGISIVMMAAIYTFSIVSSWLYEALMTSSARQATVGKSALGLRVTDDAGARLSFGRATGRHFAKYISSMTLAIGFIIAAFTARKQALHDMVASTFVVQDRSGR